MVERTVAGAQVPMPAIIRAANRKQPLQIEREIRQAHTADPGAVGTRSMPRRLRPLLGPALTGWLLLPSPLRRLLWRWALRDPHRRKRLTGTVGLTAMSMYGHGTGWGVAPMAHTLTLVVGGVSRSPAVVGAAVVARERVCLTLTFDHDVIDGAPAARFARRLIQLIESGAGLQDQGGEPRCCIPPERR